MPPLSTDYVFMSYSRRDDAVMRRIVAFLREQGIKVWVDNEKLIPGTPVWEKEIEKAVQGASAVVVALSPDSKDSEWVRREISLADQYEKRVFPLLVRGDEKTSISIRLIGRQYVDIRSNEDAGLNYVSTTLLRYLEELNERELDAKRDADLFVAQKAEPDTKENLVREKLEKPAAKPLPIVENKNERVNFTVQKNNLRWLGVGGMILFIFICGGFGLNYLIKNLPVAIATTPSANDTPAFELATLTNVPLAPTTLPTETPNPTPALEIGSTEISPKDGMTLLYVPAGEFTMGSDVNPDEQPIHKVTLDGYWIDQTEVTNAQYVNCVSAGECSAPSDTTNYANPNYANHPVVYVSWNDAVAYCSWAGRKLPTEAEWEKAARGPNANIYPWGDDAPTKDLLNYNSNVGDTTVVKNYPNTASFYGTYDMAGNVWEWVNDWYDVYPGGDSAADADFGQKYRVLRGSSWESNDNNIRSANRNKYASSLTDVILGFRCSRSQP